MPLDAVIIRLGVRPTVRRSRGLPLAAIFCVGMIGVGCAAAMSISNTAVAMTIFLLLLIVPALIVSGISTSQFRTQRPAAFDELLTSISSGRGSITSADVCRRYAEFRQQFDLQFLGFEFAPSSSQPFVSDFRRLEAAAGFPLPRIWLLGKATRWDQTLHFLQTHDAKHASTFRALSTRLHSRWIVGQLAITLVSVAIAGLVAAVVQRSTSSPEIRGALICAALVLALVVGDFLLRQVWRQKELRFVSADPPFFTGVTTSMTDNLTHLVDWDDLICFVQDLGHGRWPYSYANGRPDLRIVSLSQGFVVDLIDLPPIPEPWLESMRRTLKQHSAD